MSCPLPGINLSWYNLNLLTNEDVTPYPSQALDPFHWDMDPRFPSYGNSLSKNHNLVNT
jgi:hypothetical protein